MTFLRFVRFVFLSAFLFTFVNVSFAEGFSDVDGYLYKESIERLFKMDIVNGYEDGSFKPFNSVNRAEMLKMVFLALDEEAGEYDGGCFSDVSDEWFAPYVCKAKDLGIVKGYEDGSFKPAQKANMVETLKIVFEAFGFPLDDLKEGENWYVPYMNFAHENNIFSKYNYFSSRNSQRGEVAFLVDKSIDIDLNGVSEVGRFSNSAGCGKIKPSVTPSSFSVGGVERSAIVVVPSSYDYNKPLSLIFAFHGRTNANTRVRGYYGIEKAAKDNAIVVYPAGLKNGSSFSWSDGGDTGGELRDYEFFDVMFEEISSNYCVNLDEVYAMGHSLGGWFTNSLACARGDVLRGVASLGGSRSNSACRGPVAVMQWHNPNDRLASFSSGVVARDQFLEQNKCSSDFVSVEPSSGNCVEYQGCSEGASVVWCPHTSDYDSRGVYYPHNWPRGTGEKMWKFLDGLK